MNPANDITLDARRLLQDLRSGSDEERQRARARIESDPELARQIERLMAATIDVAPPETGAEAAHGTRRVGPYTLVDELGSGGMGAVFLAERDVDGTRQRVALKLLHGVPTQEGRRRFARERSLLAGLNHPHIAALLDGGESEAGQPYLVMEFVDGLPISEWAHRERPSLRTRLRTLVRVCRAVEHAHQRLVLHRDIKPGNVLVRGDGNPVLLDFGIGRVLGDTLAVTETATLAFTPAYAAPEQLTGHGLTTATDVYGLGALIFEVLSGIDLAQFAAPGAVLPAPSSVATDAHARRALAGDLDRIVAKSMHPDPARRYETAAALADDIERYLAGRPVLATPDSVGYRVRKFLQRHRAASAIAAAALLLMAGFVWRLDVERQRALAAEARAQREARSAVMARNFLVSVFAAATPEETLGKPITPRQLLDGARDRIVRELAGEPDVALVAWSALADTYSSLGVPAAAAAAAEEALKLATGQGAEAQLLRAEILGSLGVYYDNLGRYDEAVPLYDEMLSLRERWAADDPKLLFASYQTLGFSAHQHGENERARLWLQRALDLLDARLHDQPKYAETRSELLTGMALAAIASTDESAAQRWLRQAEDSMRGLPAEHPRWIPLLGAQARLAELQGRFADSLALLQQASDLAVRLVGAQASAVALIENDLGVALNGVGRYREALEHLNRARELYAKELQGGAASTAHLDANIGAIHESMGDYPQAIDYARRALAVFAAEGMVAPFMRRQTRVNLARALSFSGEHAQALEQMRIALQEGIDSEGSDSLTHQLDRFRHASMLRRAGQLDAAARELESSSAAILAIVGQEHPMRFHMLRMEALISRDRGEIARALGQMQVALEFAATHADADPVAVAELRVEMAELLRDGEPRKARALLDEALPTLQQSLAEVAPTRLNAERLAQAWR